MKKDFQRWHEKKSQVDEIAQRAFFHEREVWFCYLGANVGFEQDGIGENFMRPVVVFRKFNNEIFWAVPLTKAKKGKKKNKKSSVYYYHFSFIKDIDSVAILSQIRLVDVRRLARHIGVVSDKDFDNLKEKLKALLP